MIKITKTLFYVLLVALVASACSKENEVTSDDNGQNGTANGCEVVFQFQTPAVEAEVTRGVDDSYQAEQGTEKEWLVKSVKIFLFDSQTGLRAKAVDITQLERSQGTINGYVTYLTKPVVIPQGTYDIFAVANYSGKIDATTEQEFLATVDASTYKQGLLPNADNPFVMSNRASANTSVELKEKKEENLVSITLERALARIDVGRKNSSFVLNNASGVKYADVSLDGFRFVNLPKSYYLFRHTATLTSMDTPQWDIHTHFGDIPEANGYVIDPYFFSKPIDANGFNNPDAYYENFSGNLGDGDALSWTDFPEVSTTPSYKTFYSLENCMIWQAQKKGYSTGLVFKASINPNNNVYKADASGKLVLASQAEYPDSLYFFDYKFYTSKDALAKAGVDITQIGDIDEMEYQNVKMFRKKSDKYVCYYDYWIKHLDNNDPYVMGVMEFAVVRNNLYRLLITSISELGNSTPQVDPDTPDEGETSIKALINVKPWVVRDQTNIIL